MQTSVRDWSASMVPASAICTQRVWHDSFIQFTYVYWLIHSVPQPFWSKETSPRGGPPGGGSYLLCSLIKNPKESDPPRSTWYKFFEGGPLPPGSWLGNIVNRKPPRGEGFLSMNLHVDFMSVLLFYCANNAHATRMDELCHAYEWVISHMWIHVTIINESCHTYEWVMSHIWMSHVTHMNESCHTYEWVMSHICMSHVTHVNESCHTYKWVMSHIWMSRLTRMKESCHMCEWVVLHFPFRKWTLTTKYMHKHNHQLKTYTQT